MSQREMLVMLIPAARTDEVVDLLMACDAVEGFTRVDAARFSREHSRFSLRESVQGYVDQARFELIADAALIDDLLRRVGEELGRDGFFYFTQAVLREGHGGGAGTSSP